MWRYEINVPGEFTGGVAFLDLETAKVPVEGGGYAMANGEILRKRWDIVMAGVALDGTIGLLDAEGRGEISILDGLSAEITSAGEIVYGATRQFDEMIAKGRFTNARRAHAPSPFFPAVPGADGADWRNVGIEKSDAKRGVRGADCASRDVPELLRTGGMREWQLVIVHLLRDVCDLLLVAGEPDGECDDWCHEVLESYPFAVRSILSGGKGSAQCRQ